MSANALFRRYSHLKIFIIMNYLGILNKWNLFDVFQLLCLLNVNIYIHIKWCSKWFPWASSDMLSLLLLKKYAEPVLMLK